MFGKLFKMWQRIHENGNALADTLAEANGRLRAQIGLDDADVGPPVKMLPAPVSVLAPAPDVSGSRSRRAPAAA